MALNREFMHGMKSVPGDKKPLKGLVKPAKAYLTSYRFVANTSSKTSI